MQNKLIAQNQSVTVGVSNRGANMEQELKHLLHVRQFTNSDVLTMTESNVQSALESMTYNIQTHTPCNYIILHGSVRNNPVYCSLGTGKMRWQLVNGVLYPLADFWNPGTIGSTVYRIPTMENHSFSLTVWYPTIITGYQDAIAFEHGYLPDSVETKFVTGLDVPIR